MCIFGFPALNKEMGQEGRFKCSVSCKWYCSLCIRASPAMYFIARYVVCPPTLSYPHHIYIIYIIYILGRLIRGEAMIMSTDLSIGSVLFFFPFIPCRLNLTLFAPIVHFFQKNFFFLSRYFLLPYRVQDTNSFRALQFDDNIADNCPRITASLQFAAVLNAF